MGRSPGSCPRGGQRFPSTLLLRRVAVTEASPRRHRTRPVPGVCQPPLLPALVRCQWPQGRQGRRGQRPCPGTWGPFWCPGTWGQHRCPAGDMGTVPVPCRDRSRELLIPSRPLQRPLLKGKKREETGSEGAAPPSWGTAAGGCPGSAARARLLVASGRGMAGRWHLPACSGPPLGAFLARIPWGCHGATHCSLGEGTSAREAWRWAGPWRWVGEVELGWAVEMGWGCGDGLGTRRWGSEPAQEQSGWGISIPGDEGWPWTCAPMGHPPPQQTQTPTHGTRHQGTGGRRTGTPGTHTPLCNHGSFIDGARAAVVRRHRGGGGRGTRGPWLHRRPVLGSAQHRRRLRVPRRRRLLPHRRLPAPCRRRLLPYRRRGRLW